MTYAVGIISFFDNDLRVRTVEAPDWVTGLFTVYCQLYGQADFSDLEVFKRCIGYSEACSMFTNQESIIEHVKTQFFTMDMMFDVRKFN